MSRDMKCWSDKSETFVREACDISRECKEKHSVNASWFESIYEKVASIGMIAGPLCGVIISLEEHGYLQRTYYGETLLSTLGFVSGLAMALVKFGDIPSKIIINKKAAVEYANLEDETIESLKLPRGSRLSAEKYIEHLKNKMELLSRDGSGLPKSTRKKQKNYLCVLIGDDEDEDIESGKNKGRMKCVELADCELVKK